MHVTLRSQGSCRNLLPSRSLHHVLTGSNDTLSLSPQVPDTPEDEGGLGANAGAEPGSGELLRRTLRKSVEKVRGAAAAAAAEGGSDLAAAAGVSQAPALTRDLADPQQPTGPPALVLLPASLQKAAAGATPPAPPQPRRPAPPASFLAGVKAALQEASAGGVHAQQQAPALLQRSPLVAAAEVRGNGSALPAALGAALAPRQQHTAPARGRQAPQLALHRSPHESGAAPKRSAAHAAALPAADANTDLAAEGAAVERTPQAQLGLRPVPGAGCVPSTGRTDGSGGVMLGWGVGVCVCVFVCVWVGGGGGGGWGGWQGIHRDCGSSTSEPFYALPGQSPCPVPMCHHYNQRTADMDPEFLNGVALLEQQHELGGGGAPQLPQAAAEGAAHLQQQISNQQQAAPAAQALVQPAVHLQTRSAEAPTSEYSPSASACQSHSVLPLLLPACLLGRLGGQLQACCRPVVSIALAAHR